MKFSILHISICDKFLPPYITFIKENFNFRNHKFLLLSGMADKNLILQRNIYLAKQSKLSKIKYYFLATIYMHLAKKIILHGLFDIRLVFILFFMPWLKAKCYWVIWGGDLYIHELGKKDLVWKLREFFRKIVIRNLPVITTTVPGDYELAKEWYVASGKFVHNLMYPSHLARNFQEQNEVDKNKGELFLQVGNSADPTNNHEEVFEYLSLFEDKVFKVFCPLSYGDKSYKEMIIEKGYSFFGKNFIPLTDFMSFDEYNKFMNSIDIAIFNHNRQQGMGNIIGLLSLGKKVILKQDITSYRFLKSLGIKIWSLNDKEVLSIINQNDKKNNILIVRNYFSRQRLRDNWANIFND